MASTKDPTVKRGAKAAARRPKGVPPEAIFDPVEGEWQLGTTTRGKPVGEVTWWRPDGSLGGRSIFDDHGELHGVARRFHTDGTVSLESRYVHGVRWGRTRHTRTRRGVSPENVHMATFPKHVFEVSMAYADGEVLVLAIGNLGVAKEPPESRGGWFPNFAREIRKYEPGTAFSVLGTLVDVAKQRFDVPVLFYDGPAYADYSVLRFAFAPPGERTSKVPTWQDPDYGTAITLAEAQKKLLLAVDSLDLLLASGAAPPELGFSVEIDTRGFSLREVRPRSLAAKAGLRDGDVLVSLNGTRLRNPGDFMAERSKLVASGQLQLGIQRGKQALDVELRVSRRKKS